MFYKISDDVFLLVEGTTSTTFTSEDKEGFYSRYLTWLAEGNTPEEWAPDVNQ